jgi:predicted transcriptional regulator
MDPKKQLQEYTMSRRVKIQKVLEILAQNIEKNVQPDLVDSTHIAGELNMTISETKQIIKTMQEMGVIESSVEADYSLITRAGLESVGSYAF